MINDDGSDYLYMLFSKYAALKNPHLFFDLRNIPQSELEAELKSVEKLIQEVLEVGEV